MKAKRLPFLAAVVLVAVALVGVATAGECCCGCCWFTGGGTIMNIDGRQSFGGNAMTMKDKPIQGEWEYVVHATGDIFHGKVTDLYCYSDSSLPGPSPPKAVPNFIVFSGTGVYNHEEGYIFQVQAYDSGEPASANGPGDHYWVKIWDPSGAVVVDEKGAISGNFQIHPPNNGHPCV
jgi:hypothetical protein